MTSRPAAQRRFGSRKALYASVGKAYCHGYCSGPRQLHLRCCACGGRAGVFYVYIDLSRK
jgi:hypothetical protein